MRYTDELHSRASPELKMRSIRVGADTETAPTSTAQLYASYA